mmetsp:Transcript_7122/g.19150  ORF Transcript_7122/g.19150 Transcript_7122/m.19150 type:complete len:233 (+) Transcript_7122:2375-3073(+)
MLRGPLAACGRDRAQAMLALGGLLLLRRICCSCFLLRSCKREQAALLVALHMHDVQVRAEHRVQRALAGIHTHGLRPVGACDGDPVSWPAKVHVALIHVHGHIVGGLALWNVVGLLLHLHHLFVGEGRHVVDERASPLGAAAAALLRLRHAPALTHHFMPMSTALTAEQGSPEVWDDGAGAGNHALYADQRVNVFGVQISDSARPVQVVHLDLDVRHVLLGTQVLCCHVLGH